MPAVLLVVYGVPLYNVSTFWINVEILAERDAQGRILSIYYSEVARPRVPSHTSIGYIIPQSASNFRDSVFSQNPSHLIGPNEQLKQPKPKYKFP
jgi:hypothetical protein